jgi:hypothetical protein
VDQFHDATEYPAERTSFGYNMGTAEQRSSLTIVLVTVTSAEELTMSLRTMRQNLGLVLGKRNLGRPRAGRSRRFGVERLEDRVTPTVVFHPYFGSEPTTHGGGEKLNSPPIELIFWGTTYWNNPADASASAIANAVSTMMSGPSWQHLSQYGAGGSPYLADWWIDNDHGNPGSVITDNDVRNEIVNAINDVNAPIYPPSNFSPVIPLYIVVTPQGTAIDASSIPDNGRVAGGDQTVIGYHFDWNASTNYGTYNLVYAWIGNYYLYGLGGTLNNLDSITSPISHETSEAMSDAQPFSGITCSAGSSLPGGGNGEIGDFEPEDYNLDLYRVNGVLVQAMWDYNAQAFTVSDGSSQHLDLFATYTHNPDGSYTYTGSILDVFGDQFGSGYNDSITLDSSLAGGVQVTMNGESYAFEPGIQIVQINVYPGTGTNTVQVNSVTSNCPVYITGDGVNYVTVGNPSNGVQRINSLVYTYNGYPTASSTGWSTLTINDAADTVSRSATMYDDDLGGGIHRGSIWGLAPAPIYWLDNTSGTYTGGVESLSIYGGSGSNTFTIFNDGSLWSGTYLSSGSGNNATFNNVNVESTTGYLAVDGGSSDQSVYVGSNGYFLDGVLSAIQGGVFVENSNTSGFTYLYIDDSGDTTGQTFNLTFDQVTSTAFPSFVDWNTYGPGYGGVIYLSVRGGSGFNTFNVYATGSGPFSYTTEVQTGTGGATVNVQSTLGSLQVYDNDGFDMVNVGSLAPTLGGGTLANIQGYVNVYGSSTSSIALNLDDSGDTTSHTEDMYDGVLFGLAPAAIYWTANTAGSALGGVNVLRVLGSSGNNAITVHSTSAFYYYTWLNGTGGGISTVNVLATTPNTSQGYSSLYVDGGAGAQFVYIGSNGSALGGTQANIKGTVNVYNGPNGASYLTVDDSGDSAPKTSTLTSSTLTGLAPATITFNVVSLIIDGGSGNNAYKVSSTAAVTTTTINMGAGNDSGILGGAANNLDPIQGPVTFNGQAGTNKVTANDQGSSTAHTYTLAGQTLSRTGAASITGNNAAIVVNGGSGGNAFVVTALPSTGVTLNGGSGINSLTGPNLVNTWTVNGANSGVLDSKIAFKFMSSLVGGTLNDAFKFTAAGSISGTVNGGGGAADRLDYSGNGGVAITVNLQTLAAPQINGGAPGGFSNINTLVGSTAADTLIGANVATTWLINSANGGKAGAFVFAGIENLIGGTLNDTFKFTAAGSIAGTVNGGGGATDRLDYSGNGGVAITVNLQTLAAPQINGGAPGGFSNIHSLVGSTAATDVLVGANATNTWAINGANTGNVNGFVFGGIEGLVGGSGLDVFKFVGAGSVGKIDGGTAPLHQGNWLDYSAIGAAVTVNLATGAATGVNGGAAGSIANIQNVRGGSGGNTLTGNAQGNVLVGGIGADNITGGSGASLLIGDKGADNVTGGSGGDLLIGDLTTYDGNMSALMSILAEWQSANSYTTRVNHIRSGGGLNGSHTLVFGSSVIDDGSADVIKAAPSASALDWFFQGAGDTLFNVETGEHINNA